MHAVELLALTLFEWPEASFAVHHDVARHLWDEARHSMLGEVAFEAREVDWHTVPHELSFACFPNTELEPRERYALLYHGEDGSMGKSRKRGAHHAGKPAQHAAARASGDVVVDALSRLRLGRRGAPRADRPPRARRGVPDHRRARRGSGIGLARYERIVDRDRALVRSDWWGEFYAGLTSR